MRSMRTNGASKNRDWGHDKWDHWLLALLGVGSLGFFGVRWGSLDTYGMYTYGMYTYGMYTYGMYTYGMSRKLYVCNVVA